MRFGLDSQRKRLRAIILLMSRPPDFLAVGGSRCASTYIFRVLESHPDIFMAKTKSLHFFNDHYDLGYDWYFNHFNSSSKIAGEVNPSYLYLKMADGRPIAEEVHKMSKDTKIIIVIRDPVDRTISHYLKQEGQNKIKRQDLLSGLMESQRRKSRIITDSFYYNKIMNYKKLFSERSLKIVIFERLVNKPEATFSEIFDFLGVDTKFRTSLMSLKLNSSRMIGNRIRVYDLIYRSLYRLGFSGLAKKFWEKQSKEPFVVDSQSSKFLKKLYSKDVSSLRLKLGFDLAEWKNFSQKIA